ncbi:hypothetical protein TI04_13140 [Achromatium sp. WMS2]|nr:hypothetical protein TI04_13140 [Achromatium sp. WMS2]
MVEAEALCAVIEELFKVRLNLDGVKASAGSTNETKYQLVLEKLYASIHKQRQLEQRIDIETAVIAVRLGVKFLILRRRVLDFKEPSITLNMEDIEAIEKILYEQFAVKLPGGLITICEMIVTEQIGPDSGKESKPNATKSPPAANWMTRMWQKIGGYGGVRQRRYNVDHTAILMTITQQRATKGYKFIPPSEIQNRYNELLATALHLSNRQEVRSIAVVYGYWHTAFPKLAGT